MPKFSRRSFIKGSAVAPVVMSVEWYEPTVAPAPEQDLVVGRLFMHANITFSRTAMRLPPGEFDRLLDAKVENLKRSVKLYWAEQVSNGLHKNEHVRWGT